MRKFIFLLLLIAPSLHISAQEFDQTYLKSLPEAVRDDIEERMIEQKASEKASYRLSETDSGIKLQITIIYSGAIFLTACKHLLCLLVHQI